MTCTKKQPQTYRAHNLQKFPLLGKFQHLQLQSKWDQNEDAQFLTIWKKFKIKIGQIEIFSFFKIKPCIWCKRVVDFMAKSCFVVSQASKFKRNVQIKLWIQSDSVNSSKNYSSVKLVWNFLNTNNTCTRKLSLLPCQQNCFLRTKVLYH